MKSLNSLLVLSVLSFSLVSCNKFAGKDESSFFGVEKSGIVFDGEEPAGEEMAGSESAAGADGGADGGVDGSADAGADGGAAAAGGASGGSSTDGSTTSSGSASGGYVPPVDGASGAAGGGASAGYSSASASGGAAGGSSGGSYVAPKCEDAKNAQECADMNCEAVTTEGEDPQYQSCVNPNPKQPQPPVSSGCGCGGAVKKVLVCHQQGNGGFHTINISCNALKAHLDHHNDACGACQVGQ